MAERAPAITPRGESSSEVGRRSAASRSCVTVASKYCFVVAACLGAWVSCSATDDPIGFNYPAEGSAGSPEGGSSTASAGANATTNGGEAGTSPLQRDYPNLFGQLLGKTEAEISEKLDSDFEQLFHGDPATESLYVEVGSDQAYVWDPRQMDIRSDGFANALLISVELDHRLEFDRLWRFADAHLVLGTGPLRDYLRSRCDLGGDPCDETVAAEPHFAATTALWLADGRWGSAGELDYRVQAERLMAAVFRREAGAATTLGDVTGLVEPTRLLPLPTPYASDSEQAKPAAMTAAYFALWAEKSGDARPLTLAQNARAYLASVSNTETGLMPDQTALDGSVPTGEDTFSANSYPVPLAAALDAVWFGATTWHVSEANLLLEFFRAPLAAHSFAASYTISGESVAALGDLLSLQAPLSACAVVATSEARTDFVQAAWDARLNTGTSRKFGNLLYSLSSLLLSGRLRVY